MQQFACARAVWMVGSASAAKALPRLLPHELQGQAGDARPQAEHAVASPQERGGAGATAFGLVQVLRVGDRLAEDRRSNGTVAKVATRPRMFAPPALGIARASFRTHTSGATEPATAGRLSSLNVFWNTSG